MASSHANLNSGNTSQILADSLINFMNESVNILPNDEANNVTSNLISNLLFDDKGYLWKGTLQQLKRFVSKDLKLAGKRSSPGGERKIFNDLTLGITLRWSGLTRGRLTIVNDTEQNLLANALSRLDRKFNTDPNSTAASEGLAINMGDIDFDISQAGELQSGPSVIHDTNINVEVRGVKPNTTGSGDAMFVGCNSFVNSVNRVIQRDLDILKLDVSILETRLPLAISQNESNIDSVRLKQNDLEFVVWQQQQEICKLNEENQLFKLKLELIEKQLFKLIKINQRTILMIQSCRTTHLSLQA